jgi:hypothetical protein
LSQRSARWRPALGVAALLGAAACSGAAGPAPDASRGVEVLKSGPEVAFVERASAFYDKLLLRRFNTIATFQDPSLRQYFQNEGAFADYYADLAQALVDAHFERNQPLEAEVEEFVLEAPARARVSYRLEGRNGLPLRFWSTALERTDRWEKVGDQWWIVPGKL